MSADGIVQHWTAPHAHDQHAPAAAVMIWLAALPRNLC